MEQLSVNEKDPKNKLVDFITGIEVVPEDKEKYRSRRENRILDAAGLQEAIESGDITDEEICHALGSWTVAEEIAHWEALLSKTDSDPHHKEMERIYKSNLEKYRKLQEVREHYIPMGDHTMLEVSFLNKEELYAKILGWLSMHPVKKMDTKDRESVSPDTAIDEKILTKRGTTGILLSLDYPSLSEHLLGFRDLKINETDGMVTLPINIADSGSDPVDLLSALRMGEYFKHQGCNIRIYLTANPLSFPNDGKTDSTEKVDGWYIAQ